MNRKSFKIRLFFIATIASVFFILFYITPSFSNPHKTNPSYWQNLKSQLSGFCSSWIEPYIIGVRPAHAQSSSIGVLQQSSGVNGIISFEAEDFSDNNALGLNVWTEIAQTGNTSGASMVVPNTGLKTDVDVLPNAPRMDYEINFIKTGTHYIWARGIGPRGLDDSYHAGLEGNSPDSADRIASFTTTWTWTTTQMDNNEPATIVIPAPGVYTFNAFMREDGLILDKFVITTNPNYNPTQDGDEGPALSIREGSGNPAPTPDPIPDPIPNSTITLEAEDMPTKTTGGGTTDGWIIWSDGYVEESVNFSKAGDYEFEIIARGSIANGAWPNMELRVDQQVAGNIRVDTTNWSSYIIQSNISAGNHAIAVAFTNDYYSHPEDRNLFVDKIIIREIANEESVPFPPTLNTPATGDGQIDLDWGAASGATGYKVKYRTASGSFGDPVDVGNVMNHSVMGLTNGTAYYFVVVAYNAVGISGDSNELSAIPEATSTSFFTTTLEAEDMPTKTTGGGTTDGWIIWSDGYVEESVNFSKAGDYEFEIIARGSIANGAWPNMELRVDQQVAGNIRVDTTNWSSYIIQSNISAGNHAIAVAFTNDFQGAMEDRNLYVDKIIIRQIASENPSPLPPSPPSNKGAYLQDDGDNGLIVFEVENHTGFEPKDIHKWEKINKSGESGDASMQALPDNGTITRVENLDDSPRLDYEINFVKTGTHYIWTRGIGAKGEDDSFHTGIDGRLQEHTDKMAMATTTWAWRNKTLGGGERARFDILEPGVYTYNIWMREDGIILDKVVITTDPSYAPLGLGPDVSTRGGDVEDPDPIANNNIILSGSYHPNGNRFYEGDQTTVEIQAQGSSLEYQFKIGNRIIQSFSSASSVSFIPESDERARQTITAQVRDSSNTSFEILDTIDIFIYRLPPEPSGEEPPPTPPLPAEDGPFEQDAGPDGIVSFEAEDFHDNNAKAAGTWTSVTQTGNTSGASMQVPNTGAKTKIDNLSNSPRMDYKINFVKTGTHYIWARGIGPNGQDDSYHAGLNGISPTTSDRIASFGTTWTWSKTSMDNNEPASVDILETGVHTFNVFMREDGFIIDKIVITTNPDYTPPEDGPALSSRDGGTQ